jgi:hypothetical protein
MAGPLTYPPEIVIESTVDLPPEFGQDASIEVSGELIGVLIEMVFELLFSL